MSVMIVLGQKIFLLPLLRKFIASWGMLNNRFSYFGLLANLLPSFYTRTVMDLTAIKQAIALFEDFPKPGVSFKDISPLLENPEYFTYVVNQMAEVVEKMHATKIVAIDARGFLFGSAVAYKLHKGLVICRKKGKLPGKLATQTYQYEYATSEMSIQEDKLHQTDRVVIVDDVLATGNTARAAYEILENRTTVAGFVSLIELDALQGRKNLLTNTKLTNEDIVCFIHY